MDKLKRAKKRNKRLVRASLIFISSLFIFIFGVPEDSQAWDGDGHHLNAREAYEKLPKWEKQYLPEEVWERYLTDFSEYPDMRGPEKKNFKGEEELFEKLNKEFKRIGEIPGIPMDWYWKQDMPYLHGDYYMKAEFKFLVNALQEKRFWDAGMWLGCIGHWVGDQTCPGHLPMVFAWCDAYRKGWLKVTTPEGKSLNGMLLDWDPSKRDVIAKIEEGKVKVLYEKLMKGYKPKLLAPTLEEASSLAAYEIHKLYLHALELESPYIKAAWGDKKLDKEIAELVAHSIKVQLDIFHTAFMIASGKTKGKKSYPTPPLGELMEKLKKPLRDYLCYSGLIPENPEPPMIGVMVYNPPYIHDDWGNAAFYARIVLTELKRRGFNYGVITEDDLINPQKFNPQNYPVVIWHSTRAKFWRTYKSKNDCIDALMRYLREGGSLICIGGKPFLWPFDYQDGFWIQIEREVCPNPITDLFTRFMKDYLPPRKAGEYRLTVAKEAESILEGVPKQFEAEKDVLCVWDYAKFPGAFPENIQNLTIGLGEFTPLLIGGTKINPHQAIIAGIMDYSAGEYGSRNWRVGNVRTRPSWVKGKIAFLPLYLIYPFVFSERTEIHQEELFNPRMDPIPGMIFEKMVRYLEGEFRRKQEGNQN